MLIEKLGLQNNVLNRKVAIVTGSGRGIGKELAKSLAWLGAHVIIAEINDSGKEVESEILSVGNSATFIKMDVSNEDDVKSLENHVISTHGRIDILINNAIKYSAGSIERLAMSEWDKTFNVNVRGAVLLTKRFLPLMIKQNSGVINFVTSAEGTPFMAPYFASKAALSSIGQSLAAELEGSGVKVFVFAPGMVDTPGLKMAAKDLAPMFGMSETEFFKQGSNPGYDGLMPPDHCAAGWAYMIVNSEKYHGQIADPFGILLSKRLIAHKGKSRLKAGEIESKLPALLKTFDDLINSIDPVKVVLDKIEKESENLGIFAKKWVHRAFVKRCGLKLEDFKLEISKMEENISEIKTLMNEEEYEELNLLSTGLPWYSELLNRLGKHIENSKKDAKGWIKDPKELDFALNDLDKRENVVNNLLHNLKLVMDII